MNKYRNSSASNTSFRGEVRIIAGSWRGAPLRFRSRAPIRPTPNLARETLFNWLTNEIHGAHCLDLFAGSGALGFEAASRGAAQVTLVEKDAVACASLRANQARLKTEVFSIQCMDARRYLKQPAMRQYDVVFLDPPYDSDLLAVCMPLLETNYWLSDDALIYAESPAPVPAIPATWISQRKKRQGSAHYQLFRRQTPDLESN